MIQAGILLCSMLLVSVASGAIYGIDDNFIEYGPAPTISLPYPYQPSPSYNKHHGNIFVPVHAPTEIVEVVEPAGLLSTAISTAINAVRSMVVFLLANAPGLIGGGAVALGLCKLTTLCDSKITIYEAQTELRSFATPERLSRAANFVKEAVKKYNEMQKK